MKTCNRCKTNKPLASFSKNAREANGLCRECKECSKARAKDRYKKEGDKLRRQMADQRAKDYEYRLSIERASRHRRKEAQRPLKNARQSVRNRVLQGSKFALDAKQVAKIYASSCFSCGTNKNISLDHVIPIARGGNHSIGNLMPLCQPCNSSKGKKLLVEWRLDLQKIRGEKNRTLRILRR
jgi:5-methylcytosine-specific restriction endonuclease McrA